MTFAVLLPVLNAMTCHEARQFCAALIAGELGISETALVEAHLSRCADCRQIVEGLYHVAPRDSEGRIVVAGDMGIGAGSRLLLPLLVMVALGAGALVVVPGLAPYAWHRAAALVVAAPHATPQPTTRTTPPPPEPSRIEPPSGAPLIEPDVISPSSPSASSVSLAATSPSAPAPTESQQTAAATTAPSDKVAERASAAPAPRAPAPSSRPASTQKPAESAATASARKAEPRQARHGEQAALADPEPTAPPLISPVKATETDVVLQISVRDRRVAERDVNTLLARLGGTNLGQAEGATIVAVVPQSSYGEFTRGLAQMGSWNLEASRSSLPDPIHVAVRLTK
jgi:putative zinc finger protein